MWHRKRGVGRKQRCLKNEYVHDIHRGLAVFFLTLFVYVVSLSVVRSSMVLQIFFL